MATQEVILHPSSVVAELKKNNISHVVWLPDSETNFMFQLLTNEPTLDLVPVCREGETMAIAAGLWVGGKRPIVLIQNTGIFEAGDSIRGLGLDVNQPLVMLVGYRGWSRHGLTKDSAARFIEHILHAWGITYYLIETDEDADRISLAIEEADRTLKPVAVLVGTEFGS
jgi:sulfopyruvate decarboxylase TPP-binding subunit|tara:strand:- start:411 stop:917 length:507 start_codon:yes stop_codon:yes gene_type:complete